MSPRDSSDPLSRPQALDQGNSQGCATKRWHDAEGRENALRRLGIAGRRLKAALTGRGASHMSRTGSVQSALSNQVLRRYGFFMPSNLAAAE